MELILGTVQFGLAYGIAGKGARVPDEEIRAILQVAWQAGIRLLDTAPAYGNIEERLDGLIDGFGFEVISKVGGGAAGGPLNADQTRASLERSRHRLGRRLTGVLFHNAADLAGASGATCWSAAKQWADRESVRLGCSGYAPSELAELHSRLDLDFVQLPGNALDQRAARQSIGVREVHLRSSFLQGLLLMPLEQATLRLPAAAMALQRWHDWLHQRSLSPIIGALSVVKSFPGVTHCLVGVDDVVQMAAIVEAWERSVPVKADDLSESELDVIDPRRWRLA